MAGQPPPDVVEVSVGFHPQPLASDHEREEIGVLFSRCLLPHVQPVAPGIGLGVRRNQNVGSVALPASPAQKTAVAPSVLSGEGQQREPAASVFSDNLSLLFWGEVASGGAGLR